LRNHLEIGPSSLVILVEDHALHARLLRRALEQVLAGCAVELFDDGLRASHRLLDPTLPPPTLLVLDLDLPGRSGHELLGDRARDARLAGVPVAVVSSSELSSDRERSLALGANLHLEKPLDADGFQDLAGQLAALVAAK
jgi:CheY-like chemotaxis protein